MNTDSPQLPLDEHGTPFLLDDFRIPAPVCKRAFDHPETRAAWERTHRKLRRRRTVWWVLCPPSFLAVSSLMSPDAGATPNKIGGIALIAWVLGYPCVLYFCSKSLGCLKRMRRVLETYPWRLIPHVYRPSGPRDMYTAAVQLQYTENEELTGLNRSGFGRDSIV